jgi:MFS family permease
VVTARPKAPPMPTPPSSSATLEPISTRSAAPDPVVLLSKPFVLALCVQFSFGLSYSSFFLLPKYLARVYHANADVIGAVAATALLAGVLAVPFIGAAIDAGSRRSIITAGSLINAFSAAGFALVHRVALPLYALRALNGISYALVFNAIVTLAVDLAPAKKIGQAIGLCGAAGMLANALSPALGEYIADRQGWSFVFWLAGGAALVATGLSLLIREPTAKATKSQSDAAFPSALRLMLKPERAGAFACSAAAGAGFGVMFTFTQPFALLLGAKLVSSFFLGYTMCALFARLGLGSLADTWGRRPVVLCALATYGLVTCLTSLLRPELLFAVGAGLGLAHGLLYPALNALAIDGVPRARRGTVMTYFLGSFNAGYAVWVMGLGVVAKTHGYPLLFVATGGLLWASMLVLPKKREGLTT